MNALIYHENCNSFNDPRKKNSTVNSRSLKRKNVRQFMIWYDSSQVALGFNLAVIVKVDGFISYRPLQRAQKFYYLFSSNTLKKQKKKQRLFKHLVHKLCMQNTIIIRIYRSFMCDSAFIFSFANIWKQPQKLWYAHCTRPLPFV